MKRRIFALICMLLIMTSTAYGAELTWETAPGHHNQSILLESGINSSEDSVSWPARGEYLSMGKTTIVNQEDGSIYITVDTFAHINVDRIQHSVFLDQWDEDAEDWVQVGDWDFRRTKEEEGGELSDLLTTMTLTGFPANKYYRARALHMVVIGDEMEGCATETNGVLITDN